MNTFRTNSFWLVCVLAFSISVDLVWHSYVGFVRDDAYITYRYAENIANGAGFVYNTGEHVYGTSSPGLAVFLAAWLNIFPNPLNAALGLDILASTVSLLLIWKLLEHFSIPVEGRILSLFILTWSDKLLLHFMEGMENPLVVSCMIASLYFMVKEKPIAAGFLAGWMLWLRLDSALWVLVLGLVGWFCWRRNTIFFLLVTGFVYLPWLIFAQLYFGSFIPLTAIAKQAAYGIGERPWTDRFMVLYGWLAPFTILGHPVWARIASFLTISIAACGVWRYRKILFVQVIALFLVLQSSAVILLNMTVEQRYMVYPLYALLILLGFGILAVWPSISLRRIADLVLLLLYGACAFVFAFPRIEHFRDLQRYVNDMTLTPLGKFLKQHSPTDSVVFLEPLGYVGYYSERRMLDAVGLATPAMVPLIRAGNNWDQIIARLDPDYLVLHCDDAGRMKSSKSDYGLLIRFDPLDFESGVKWKRDSAVQRNACYEIHAKSATQ
ncbi:MAG TPA: hypothetical protein VK249_01075 [Anaerolineales bacterium]|nr:hypothetical protein [Anaerolineales bacterium]